MISTKMVTDPYLDIFSQIIKSHLVIYIDPFALVQGTAT